MKRKDERNDKYSISVDIKPGSHESVTKSIFTGAVWLSCAFILAGLICVGVGGWVFVKFSVNSQAAFDLKRMIYTGPAAGLFLFLAGVCFWGANLNFKAR